MTQGVFGEVGTGSHRLPQFRLLDATLEMRRKFCCASSRGSVSSRREFEMKTNPHAARWNKTDGRCHLCAKKLAFKNYGLHGARGAWEWDHSVARARGGSDHGNNLFPACISCNRSKQTSDPRTVRRLNRLTRSPMGVAEKARVRGRNGRDGAFVGAVSGFAAGVPIGGILGFLAGQIVGESAPLEAEQRRRKKMRSLVSSI